MQPSGAVPMAERCGDTSKMRDQIVGLVALVHHVPASGSDSVDCGIGSWSPHQSLARVLGHRQAKATGE